VWIGPLAAVIISELGVDMSVFGMFHSWLHGRGFARQQRIGRQAQSAASRRQCLSDDALVEAATRRKSQGHLLEDKFTVSKPDVDTSEGRSGSHKILVAI